MRLATFVCAGLVAVVGITAPITAYAQSAEEILVEKLDLKDADMITATRMLTDQTGLQFVIEPSDEPFKRVTLKLNNVTADVAIRYICQAAGATARRDANGVIIISRGSKVTEIVNPTTPATNNVPRIAKKIKLLKANARDVLGQIKDENYVPQDTLRFLNGKMAEAGSVNMRSIGSVNLFGAGPAYQPIDSNMAKAMPESAKDITLPGEGAGQLAGGAGGGFGGGGQGGRGGGAGQGGPGGAGGQGGGQGNLQAGQGLVPQSIDFISYDPTDNSIVVRGTDEDIAELQRYISLFDVAPKQVTIKVEFITTSSSFARSLGFDWLYERGQVFSGIRPGSFARAGDPIFFNWASGNITARMRALMQEGHGRVVQAPVIRTLNNQPGFVTSTVQTTLFITTVVSAGNGQIVTAPQVVQFPVTTGLGVAPRINEDGTVTVFVSVQLSDFGQLRRSARGDEFPDILTQSIGVVARVKSGETIALGGLTRKQDVGSVSRFPILSDLPIVGQFFKATTRDRNNSELIIFVTPTVIEDETTGSVSP